MKIKDQVLRMLSEWQRPPDVLELVPMNEFNPARAPDKCAPVRARPQEPMKPVSIVMDEELFRRAQLEATEVNESLELSRREMYALPVHIVPVRHGKHVMFVQVERYE